MRALFALFLFLSFSVQAYAADLTIGLIPEQNVFKQQERYKPLGDYLTKKTGIKIKFTILSRYGNIIERFTAEKMDGAFFGSFTGALAIKKLGVEPIARPVNLDGSSTYYGYIFVRNDSGIKNVHDMKNKKIAFVEKATTAGYIYPVAYFKEHGIANPEGYFKELYFAGSHDAAINAVLEKKADIGCAKHSMFDRVAKKNPAVQKELKILVSSPHVPSNGLAVRKNLDAATKKKLRDALINMANDAEGVEALKKFEALKFIPTSNEDYKAVFDIANKAGIDIATYKYVNK
ncbi:MAG: phosphate/phosphite/phosphonate ABC transporter substrate-binding protein [Nitrospirae bacterium]|nr:MAG: phosphate/phosphite/phosphonate ABC transporter substrate-binding protein [Nitrospirota bacterium]